jgi:hypothetical protein
MIGSNCGTSKSWLIRKHPAAPSPTRMRTFSSVRGVSSTWITGSTTGPVALNSLWKSLRVMGLKLAVVSGLEKFILQIQT